MNYLTFNSKQEARERSEEAWFERTNRIGTVTKYLWQCIAEDGDNKKAALIIHDNNDRMLKESDVLVTKLPWKAQEAIVESSAPPLPKPPIQDWVDKHPDEL